MRTRDNARTALMLFQGMTILLLFFKFPAVFWLIQIVVAAVPAFQISCAKSSAPSVPIHPVQYHLLVIHPLYQ
eukprot:12633863-Ditylum_brightwellii.AAC.3